MSDCSSSTYFFFPAEDGIRDFHVTGVQTCALPIFGHDEATEGQTTSVHRNYMDKDLTPGEVGEIDKVVVPVGPVTSFGDWLRDRKSTRLNSSHVKISYAVFCLKKKKQKKNV